MAGRYQFDHPWWDNVSDRAKDFVKRLLVVDIKKRYTAVEALNHPFITQLHPVPLVRYEAQVIAVKLERDADVDATSEDLRGPLTTKALEPKKEKVPRELSSSIDTVHFQVTSPRENVRIAEEKAGSSTRRNNFSAKVNRLASWIRTTVISSEKPRKST
jgi:serine/threonine protein kinase